jgi:hypothetical protein
MRWRGLAQRRPSARAAAHAGTGRSGAVKGVRRAATERAPRAVAALMAPTLGVDMAGPDPVEALDLRRALTRGAARRWPR